jgi:hypothetical protein
MRSEISAWNAGGPKANQLCVKIQIDVEGLSASIRGETVLAAIRSTKRKSILADKSRLPVHTEIIGIQRGDSLGEDITLRQISTNSTQPALGTGQAQCPLMWVNRVVLTARLSIQFTPQKQTWSPKSVDLLRTLARRTESGAGQRQQAQQAITMETGNWHDAPLRNTEARAPGISMRHAATRLAPGLAGAVTPAADWTCAGTVARRAGAPPGPRDARPAAFATA